MIARRKVSVLAGTFQARVLQAPVAQILLRHLALTVDALLSSHTFFLLNLCGAPLRRFFNAHLYRHAEAALLATVNIHIRKVLATVFQVLLLPHLLNTHGELWKTDSVNPSKIASADFAFCCAKTKEPHWRSSCVISGSGMPTAFSAARNNSSRGSPKTFSG